MARYIDADKLIEFANNHKDKMIDANDIARFPRADVVPKSEVARDIFEEIENNVLMIISDETFAELKKKYTEGNNDEV